MDTEFNYLYEDKYYENAVKNLKSTFYDVVEREEIMLNSLENRIAQETDPAVKERLLNLWSKQNDSLDQSIVLFRELKKSVRVIDSFVQELADMDKAIVADIINQNNNNVRSARVEEMEQQDVMEQPVMEKQVQEEVPENTVEEQAQEEVPENAVEEQVQEEVSENAVEEQAQEENTENVAEEQAQEEVTENAVEEQVQEEVTDNAVEEQVQEKVPENVVEEQAQEEVTDNAVEEQAQEKVTENTVEEQVQKENNDAVEEEISMELPTIEATEDNNSQESVENDDKKEETVEEENAPLIPLEDESKKENNSEEDASAPLIPIDDSIDLENISIDTNTDSEQNESSTEETADNTLENTDSSEEPVLENVEEAEDEIHFDESFNTEEVPEMEVINEETDGMDLPNVVEADKIDFSAIDEEENKEEVETTDEVVEIPTNKNETPEENIDIDKVSITHVGKEDNESPKAIIVTGSQFDKLNESYESQENKLYSRGYLSNEIINNSNYTLSNNIKSADDEHDSQLEAMVSEDYTIPENPTREDMEGLIEKAAELYKSGKKHEAQALYEEISRINDEMHQEKAPELVKAA